MNATTACQSDLESLIQAAEDCGASDLLLVVGHAPRAVVRGEVRGLPGTALSPSDLDALFLDQLDESQYRRLQAVCDLDLHIERPNGAACRLNLHYQQGGLAAALRLIPATVPKIEQLCLPEILFELTQLPHGLVLVTGPTGHGKSTTLAAMIQYINESSARHVVTLEDPIEFRITSAKGLVEQREIGRDSPDFATALRHVVRTRPDVLMVGEMRDRETIATAVTAAETGHLVLASLHTVSASQTVDRIVDVFEAAQQNQIRSQLSHTLQAVVTQTLIREADGRRMVPACEILVATPAVRRIIREADTHLLPGIIETGSQFGMQTLEQAVQGLVHSGRVDRAEAMMWGAKV